MDKATAEAEFDKQSPEFEKALRNWVKEKFEKEAAHTGGGGDIWSVGPAVSSISVIGAVDRAEDTFKISVKPDDLILKGGYDTTDHFIEDFMPKLRAIYVEKKTEKEEANAC